MDIYKRIKSLRKALKLSQTDFGKKIGVSLRGVQKWEAEQGKIREASLLLLEKTYGVNPVWLRTGEGEMFLKEALKTDFDSDEPLPREHTLVMHAVRHMSVEEAQDLLKYIEDKEAAKKYREMLKKEQAG